MGAESKGLGPVEPQPGSQARSAAGLSAALFRQSVSSSGAAAGASKPELSLSTPRPRGAPALSSAASAIHARLCSTRNAGSAPGKKHLAALLRGFQAAADGPVERADPLTRTPAEAASRERAGVRTEACPATAEGRTARPAGTSAAGANIARAGIALAANRSAGQGSPGTEGQGDPAGIEARARARPGARSRGRPRRRPGSQAQLSHVDRARGCGA